MDDTRFRYIEIQRELEKDGVRKNAPATQASFLLALDAIKDNFASVAKRLTALEKQVAGMQVSLDHTEKHALCFMGDWQPEQEYHPAAFVRHRGKTYTALRRIAPGKSEPGRDGSGWSLVV